ncbi:MULTISPECIES: hypothetical protein [Methylotenera]|uniref:SET domain-containing protein n=1 Tax=Methylotenera oryzisoli TaxID=2080758 RepID=A0A4Y9VT59_9PROT|nr:MULTISPECIES: hypothetical protein [Methylotenera]TFW72510.1 hypothetical protein C3Y98_02560 [Methylotenera oryzisoli]
MQFTEILDKFRALGGVADNIELRHGRYGRGIFPINPNKPIKIKIPSKLLASPSWLVLDRDNHIRIKPKLELEPAWVDFYESYQQFFGWSNVGINELSEYHNELTKLPKKIKQFLLLFGWHDEDFDKKSVKDYLKEYLASRQIRIGNESKLMPIIELINHSADGKQYIADDGVKFEGTFKDEALACYHGSFDALHFFRIYHFNSESSTVLSCDVKIEVPNVGLINISRFDAMVEIVDGVVIPRMVKTKSGIQIDFIELVNKKNKQTPRKIFTDGIQRFNVSFLVANQIFDGLIEHNRKAYSNFASECRLSNNKVAKELESIALNQLKLLNE